MRFAPQSIRVMLPLAVLGVFILTGIASLSHTDWLNQRTLEEELRHSMLLDAARLARMAEHDMADAPGHVEQEIMLHNAEKYAMVSALIDPDGHVVFAQNSEWKNRAIADVLPGWDAARFARTVRGVGADTSMDSKRAHLDVLMPYDSQASQELSSSPRGVIYLKYDLATALARERYTHFISRLPESALAMIFAALLALWLHRRVVRPLSDLTEASRRIGKGNLSVRVPVNGIGEVAELADAINVTVENLQQLQSRQQLATRVFETTGEAIIVTDTEGSIVGVNPAFNRITGYAEAEVLGKGLGWLNSERHDQAFHRALWHALASSGEWAGEAWNRRKNGEEFLEWLTISAVRDESDKIVNYIAVFADVSEIRRAQHAAEQLSWTDPLTGLSNRAHFLKQLAQTLTEAYREERYADVLLLDLDRFKDINEARGLAIGDTLLKAVAQRLRSELHEDDVLARLDSDEFAILLPRLSPDRETAGRKALTVAERLRATLREAIAVDGESVHLDASFGIALFPESPEETAADVLRQADMAMHQAKAEGGGSIVFFEAAMGEAVRERYRLERELRHAIDTRQLRLYLQPQVHNTGRQVGAEALIRWQHPERGLVPPIVFIPIAEASDLIIDIDRWMLAEVCRLLAQLDAEGCTLRISVNISPRHFQKIDFVDDIKQQLAISGADPTHLVLEVTEGLVINDINDVASKMATLTALGIHFSMDDFGTGYSSLAYLKRLPIHELKIDKSFIQDAPTDPNDAALVETILAVAQHLHLQVVAEGVETKAQATFLNTRGEEIIHQGYFYGRPEPVDKWLVRVRDETMTI